MRGGPITGGEVFPRFVTRFRESAPSRIASRFVALKREDRLPERAEWLMEQIRSNPNSRSGKKHARELRDIVDEKWAKLGRGR